MSPRTPEQFEEIRQEKKQLILDVALKLFAQEGFHATSISMIAKEAGISKGLLYNYFDSKEALLIAIFDGAIDKVWRYFDPNHDGVLTNEEFFYFIHQNFQTLKDNIDYWRIYSVLAFQPSVLKLLGDNFSGTSNDYNKMLLDFFAKNSDKEPENEVLLLAAMLKGVSILYITSPGNFPVERLENTIIEFYEERLKIKV